MADVKINIKADDKASKVVDQLLGKFFGIEAILRVAQMTAQALLKSAEKSQAFSKELDKAKKTAGEMIDSVGQIVAIVGTDLLKAFNDVGEKIKKFIESKEGMEKFAEATATVKSVFTVLGTTVGEIIKLIGNLINIGVNSAKVMGAVWDVLTGKGKLEDVKNAYIEYGKSIGKMFDDTSKGVLKIVDTTVNEVSNYKDNVIKAEKDIAKYKDDKNRKTEKEIELMKKLAIATSAIGEARQAKESNPIDRMIASFEKGKTAFDTVLKIANVIQEAFAKTAESVNTMIQGQIDLLNNRAETELSNIDKTTQAQLEALGLQDETKQESIQKEIDALEEKLSMATNIEQQKAIQDEINEKNKELKKTQILEDAEKKKQDIKKQTAKEEYKLTLAAFGLNKALSITNAIVATALATINAIQAGLSLGGVQGIAMAAVLGTMAATAGAISIATIAAQQPPPPPAFADGVTNFGGGVALVGERGPELVTMGKGSNVITNENLQRMGSISIGVVNVTANNAEEFLQSLVRIRDYQVGRA